MADGIVDILPGLGVVHCRKLDVELVVGFLVFSCYIDSPHLYVSKFMMIREGFCRNASNDRADKVGREALSNVSHQRKVSFGEGVKHEGGGRKGTHCEYEFSIAKDEISLRSLQDSCFGLIVVDLFNKAIDHYFE